MCVQSTGNDPNYLHAMKLTAQLIVWTSETPKMLWKFAEFSLELTTFELDRLSIF